MSQNIPKCINVPIAQWIARWTSNPEAAGSNPAEDAHFFLNQMYTKCHAHII